VNEILDIGAKFWESRLVYQKFLKKGDKSWLIRKEQTRIKYSIN